MVVGPTSFRWILQLHKDVPKAARFYKEDLDFTINLCTLRWAELESGPLKLALMHSSSEITIQKGYPSMLSFSVTEINTTVTKLTTLGAEMDRPIKYEIHGKVAAMLCIDGHMLGLYENTTAINRDLRMIDLKETITIKKQMKEKVIVKIEDQWESFVIEISQGVLIQVIREEIDPEIYQRKKTRELGAKMEHNFMSKQHILVKRFNEKNRQPIF